MPNALRKQGKNEYFISNSRSIEISAFSMGPALWALVGITSAFLILGIVFACYRRNQTNVPKQRAEVKNKESDKNEQSIQYSRGGLQ